jgi:hypothetical protein
MVVSSACELSDTHALESRAVSLSSRQVPRAPVLVDVIVSATTTYPSKHAPCSSSPVSGIATVTAIAPGIR